MKHRYYFLDYLFLNFSVPGFTQSINDSIPFNKINRQYTYENNGVLYSSKDISIFLKSFDVRRKMFEKHTLTTFFQMGLCIPESLF